MIWLTRLLHARIAIRSSFSTIANRLFTRKRDSRMSRRDARIAEEQGSSRGTALAVETAAVAAETRVMAAAAVAATGGSKFRESFIALLFDVQNILQVQILHIALIYFFSSRNGIICLYFQGGVSMAQRCERLSVPITYKSGMPIRETEIAIKFIKDCFESSLAKELNLTRVSAPLFVRPETGLNDNLNGVERPVSFDVMDIGGKNVEIVQSLAKWKRMALKRYEFGDAEGLYTDMNAIRRDEVMDNLHSIYVDQWDWEKILKMEERTEEKLKSIVRQLYSVFKKVEEEVLKEYPGLDRYLPDEISFVTTQQLEDMYPEKSPKERENIYIRENKAAFIMKIGGKLKSGIKHDGRAPDYDDWELNGDIVFWYPVLGIAYEVSSMGIRVDEDALVRQLKAAGCEDRLKLPFHRDLLEKRLPYTVGGGIGQSRICMFYLGKAHVGEVQSSVWPEDMLADCRENGIELL